MPVDFTSTQLGGVTNLALLAPVKPGFVDGLDTCTFVQRLDYVLKTLQALALAAREAMAESASPEDDFVGRMKIVHFFRFALVPPEPPAQPDAEPGLHRLMLNVTFDGGWEPYMRVIWRDLGTTLDLMFCNCIGYPLSHACSFESYVRWVRAHEVQGGFFYADSALSVMDQRYLVAADAASVQQRSVSAPAADRIVDPQLEAMAALRPILALHALDRVFPALGRPDAGVLLRVAHDILRRVRDNALTQKYLTGSLRERFAAPLAWFEQPRDPPVAPQTGLLSVGEAEVQGGILKTYEGVREGRLVLLRVVDAAAARQSLARFPVTTAADPHVGAPVFRNLALTFDGLRRLKVPRAQLDKFPQEFADGMARRAGVLGDVRCNHPDRWNLPARDWRGAQAPKKPLPPVDLSSVDVVVQLRAGWATGQEGAFAWAPHIDALRALPGLDVLAVERLVRYPMNDGNSREHFGFADGFSQPKIGPKTPGRTWDDAVPAGEILLGYPNERRDGRVPDVADPLFDNGTYLVVRKLRQDVATLNRAVEAAASELWPTSAAPDPDRRAEQEAAIGKTLLAAMMGRDKNGVPQVAPLPSAPADSNNFDFAQDPVGIACPFQSHMRRLNPRKDLPVPRIVRRGMSFGPQVATDPDAPRGLFFMAYSASIAEQFEILQRWAASSTPAGGVSSQSDPFLGVPDPGQPRPFGFTHNGKRVCVDLGDQPFAVLEWGLYLFVPSVSALKSLATPSQPPAPVPAPPEAPTDNFVHWQRALEDNDRREAAWQQVRAQGGVLRTDYGVLVGDPALVDEVFANQDRYSVCGYGERMSRSIGLGFLGLDPDTGHDVQAPSANAAIAKVGMADAFAAAHEFAAAYVEDALRFAAATTHRRVASIDLGQLGEAVLARLCHTWFGFPDGTHMLADPAPPGAAPPSCPAHFFPVSRFVFGVRPSPLVAQAGGAAGAALRNAVATGIQRGVRLPPVAAEIEAGVKAIGGGAALVAQTLAGIMLGFPPTTYGNLRNVAGAWLQTGEFTTLHNDLQSSWAAQPDLEEFDRASALLRERLLATMLRRPVPDMLWRTAKRDHALGTVAVREGDRVVIGIISAAQQVADPTSPAHYVMFGGDAASQPHALHACPGYAMAMGTLLGIFYAVLDAGALRPEGGLRLSVGG